MVKSAYSEVMSRGQPEPVRGCRSSPLFDGLIDGNTSRLIRRQIMPSNKLPWFKFDVTSWLTGNVRLLEPQEQGIFINLCALIWRDGGTYKIDKLTHRQLNTSQQVLNECVQVFNECDIMLNNDGILSVKFIDEQMGLVEVDRQKKSKAGKASAKKRAEVQQVSTKRVEERRVEENRIEDKKETKQSGYTAEFDEFWKTYERKGSKANAFKAWKKISNQDRLDAVTAIEFYFKECDGPQFRKDAERYLSNKVFEAALERSENNQTQSGGECAGQSIEIPREQWINYYGSERAAIDAGKIKAEVE